MARADWYSQAEHDMALMEAKNGCLVSEYRNLGAQQIDAVDDLYDRVKSLRETVLMQAEVIDGLFDRLAALEARA